MNRQRGDSGGMWSFVLRLINEFPFSTTAGALGIMIQGGILGASVLVS